jgi:hypothetical protein
MAEHIDSSVNRKVGDDQPSTAEIIKKGQAVLERLECNLRWDDEWLDLFRALGAGRDNSMRAAGVETPQGPKYREKIGAWLRCYGFDRIAKAERSRYLECYDHLAEINAWRAASPAAQRLHDPRTVLTHWKRSGQRPDPPIKEKIEAGTITIDTVIAWLKSASPADRARVIETLGIACNDVPRPVVADLVQHVVAQAREVAEQESVALLNCVASIRATMRSRASAPLQLEEIGDALRTLAKVSGPDWLARMDSDRSVFRQLGRDRSTKH